MVKNELCEGVSGILFQMPVRSRSQVVFHRWRDRLLFLIVLAAPPVGFALFYSPAALGGLLGPGTMFGAVIGVLMDITVLYTFGSGADWLGRHAWLDPMHCTELARLCATHPDLARFRDQVFSMERHFTRGEFFAMKQWPAVKVAIQAQRRRDATQRAACQRLYTQLDN